jgi:hypothetical protein
MPVQITMASVFPSATGNSHASNSRLCSGASMLKPNAAHSALSCSRRVGWGAVIGAPRGQREVGQRTPEMTLARATGARGIAESRELQRETKLVRVAVTTLFGGAIGETQGPVPDQFRFGDGQSKQLLELIAADGPASRHGQLSQYDAGPNRGNVLRPV